MKRDHIVQVQRHTGLGPRRPCKEVCKHRCSGPAKAEAVRGRWPVRRFTGASWEQTGAIKGQ